LSGLARDDGAGIRGGIFGLDALGRFDSRVAVVETGFVAASWPMLQSLVCAAGDPSQLSRRLGWYNILWSALGAIAVAASGAVIQHAPAGAFFGIIAAGHCIAGVLIVCRTPVGSFFIDMSRTGVGLCARRIGCGRAAAAIIGSLAFTHCASYYVVVYSIARRCMLHAMKRFADCRNDSRKHLADRPGGGPLFYRNSHVLA
jgi:hypothetical protein